MDWTALRSGRLWLVVAIGWLAMIPAAWVVHLAVQPLFLLAHALEPFRLDWVFHVRTLLSGGVSMGIQLALIAWLLRGDIRLWPALGVATGLVVGTIQAVQAVLNYLAFYPRFEFPWWLPIILLSPAVTLGMAGLLGRALARRPGRRWWAWLGATLLLTWLGSGTSLLALYRLPEALYAATGHVAFGFVGLVVQAAGLWWLTRRVSPHGLAALGLGAMTGLGLLLWLHHRLLLAEPPADPVATLFIAGGAVCLAAMIARQVVLPWVRAGQA